MLSPNAESYAVNQLHPNNHMTRQMNFQALTLHSIALDWTPYIKIIECRDYKNCHAEGILVDLMRIWSRMYNFTYIIDMQPDKIWGTVPMNGSSWDNCNGTFSGLFESLTKGRYDIGLSSWATDVNRKSYVDMTTGMLS